MLDTLLYQVRTVRTPAHYTPHTSHTQAHVKPYILDLLRELLGCKPGDDCGYLWHIPVTPDLLELDTYERVFQRLASQHRYIPLGIYRTIQDGHCVDFKVHAVRVCVM